MEAGLLIPRAAHRERGLTVVELLVALTVFLIGATGVMVLHGTTAGGNLAAGRGAEATEICEGTMDELREMSVAEIETTYGAIPASGWGPVPFHGGDATGRLGVVFERTVEARELATVSGNLVWLRVVVAWSDRGGPRDREVALELVRTRTEKL